MSQVQKSIQFAGHTLTLETGIIARQASGSVLVDLGGTTVLVTVVAVQDDDTSKDFFPLRVDYQEKAYAAGKIPGGFMKREGRPSEREILIARLIDRPIRPLFPKGFCSEVQIVATVVSFNPEVDPDIPTIIGASAALMLAGVPFKGPIAAARVGYKDGCYILNPTIAQLADSELDLVVAGTESSVLMVESEAGELSEDVMLGAVMFGHKQSQPVIKMIKELVVESSSTKWDWQPTTADTNLVTNVAEQYSDKFEKAYAVREKQLRQSQLKELRADVMTNFVAEDADASFGAAVNKVIADLESKIVRGQVLKGDRIDGRKLDEVRQISIKTGLLPRTHGSALFTRGETQALVTTTLGTGKDAQIMDGLPGEQRETFNLHYNFPPYCVGEIGMMGSPKRREIGHGKLAKRGVTAVIPSAEDFSYVIRVVSEITESNGSSSMATVCGSSLALMDAGVPIKSAVAGIAMGLIKEDDKFVVLSDILGDEDHLGDMDFKVVGTRKGVTALQMDIKIDGITEEIMATALGQARTGRLHILDCMDKVIAQPKEQISEYAPSVLNMKIKKDKIKDVIGKGGATIRGLIEDTGASIDISDDGEVQIAADSNEVALSVKKRIENLTAEVEVGNIYTGKVVKIVDFGAFVNILPGQDGLVHISQISKKRVNDVNEVLQEGQEVKVKVIEIDDKNRLKLSMKSIALAENN